MDRRFDGRGTLPPRPIGRLSPSAVFPVGMAEKSFGGPTVRCPASYGHSPGRLRLSGCNRPGVIFRPVPKHPPGFAFMIKRGSLFGCGMGLPCFPGYWNNAKDAKRAAGFPPPFFAGDPISLFFPAPGETFCPKDDEPISFCIIFSDAGGLFPYADF